MIRKKIKVAAYARVSTDKDDQLNSLDNQRIYFQNYIKGHPDWEFVDVYWDEGISGTQTKNRVGFNNMIADAINGKIDLNKILDIKKVHTRYVLFLYLRWLSYRPYTGIPL